MSVAIVALLAVPNFMLLHNMLLFIESGQPVFDWWVWEQATERIGTGTLYDWGAPSPTGDEYAYIYSPLFAYAMVPFIELGIGVWRALHVAALLLLPTRVALLLVVLWPFWLDVAQGNVMAFVVVAGYLALQGNRWGVMAYLALTLLVPRPLMLPLAGWIVWKRPEWRVPAMAMMLACGGLTAATGEALPFAATLASGTELTHLHYNWGPTRIVGMWWLALGVPLAVWLTARGRVGWAGLAASPYILPYYLLMPIVELVRRRTSE